MGKGRLEAFSDGVLAVIITIMVLELKAPQGDDLHALAGAGTTFLSYLLSFVYIGIYWNNHHHMFQVVERVSGTVLWANLHLLFWLSLLPATTAWAEESGFARLPVLVYGADLLLAAIAYLGMQYAIYRTDGGQALREALGSDVKGKASIACYLAGIALAFVATWPAMAAYAVVAVIWLVPDPRVERYLAAREAARAGTGGAARPLPD